jgi:hypothetical protein
VYIVYLQHHRPGARGRFNRASKIESNVALGLAEADQQIALGLRLDWVRPVDDEAGKRPRLATAPGRKPATLPE